MKTPWWESSPGATIALLVTKKFVKQNLYAIYLKGGEVLRYAGGLIDVSVPGGYYWASNALPVDINNGLSSSRAHYKIGTDVDTWQVAMSPRPADRAGNAYPDKIGDIPWTQAVRAGMLDSSKIRVDRAIFAAFPLGAPASMTPTGVVTIFYGPTAAIDFDRGSTIISIQSMLQWLTQQTPRNVFQAGCRHTLFDSGCGLSASDFATSGSVLAGSTQSIIQSGLGDPAGSGTYAQGRIVMTSGNNNNFSRAIRVWASGAMTLIVPLPFPLQIGDTFTAYPGCDKTLATCTFFNNNVNFGGEPFTPAPETAV